MRYKGFTLVEVLIVMGILIILIAIGIAVGRFAIQRANRVHHQDAVDQLYTALAKYKLDNKEYPRLGSCSSCIQEQFFAEALGLKGVKDILKPYYEEGVFDGGTDATYYYYVDEINAQFAIVCVSLGGIDDEAGLGFYCTGDGIGSQPPSSPLNDKNIDSESTIDVNVVRGFDASDWKRDGGFASLR
ncbi:MAG: type II secretion system protein [Candidatus Dojkabacteria bacterium]